MDIKEKAARIGQKRQTFDGKPLNEYKKAELLDIIQIILRQYQVDTCRVFEEDKI